MLIETSDSTYVEVKDPFTLEFQVTRNNLASANTATFTLYNLSPSLRSQIFKDQFDMGTFRAVQLFAGYDDGANTMIPQVFNGAIKRASSQREGADFKTEIEAYDGAVNNTSANVSQTLPQGSTRKQILANLVESLAGVQSSTIGNKFNDVSKRGVSLMGNPMEMLAQLTGGNFYIDSQNAYALDPSEVVPGDIRLISAENGLLGTPRKYETLVELDMLFEPRLKPSQIIELQSATEKRFNGVYKITGFTHRGTISGAIAGDCKTSVQLLQIKDYRVVLDEATQEYTLVKG